MSSLFRFDPAKRIEQLVAKGEHGKAAELLAKKKRFLEAGRIALDGDDIKSAARYFYQGATNKAPYSSDLDPSDVGHRLEASGNRNDAAAFYEAAGLYSLAADVYAQMRHTSKAALNFERAEKFTTAAQYYERCGEFAMAAAALGAESQKIDDESQNGGPTRSAQQRKRSLAMRRVNLLLRAGDRVKAAVVLKPWPARTREEAKLIEELVGPETAVDSFLAIDMPEEALRLLETDPSSDRRTLANVQRRCNRLTEAAATYAALGDDRTTAEVLEEAGKHESAARRWEKVGELVRAAHSYERGHQLADAARCFAAQNRLGRASQLYAQAGDPLQAAQCLREKGDQLGAGRMLLRAGKDQEAAQIFRQIGERDGGYPEATLQLLPYLVETEGATDEALRRLELVAQALRDPKTQPAWSYWEARCLEAGGRTAEAISAYRRLLAERSSFKDAVGRLGKLERQTQDWEEIVEEREATSRHDVDMHVAEAAAKSLEQLFEAPPRSPTPEPSEKQPGSSASATNEATATRAFHPKSPDAESALPKSVQDAAPQQNGSTKSPQRRTSPKREKFSTGDFERLLEESRRYRQKFDERSTEPSKASRENSVEPSKQTRDEEESASGEQAESMPKAPIKGEVFADRYEIQKELAQDRWGTAFRGHDRHLDEPVTIRTFTDAAGSSTNESLLKTLKLCCKVEHANVCRIHDAGRFRDGIFVSAEFVAGHNLQEVLEGQPKLELGRARSLLVLIAEGLQAIHGLGVAHGSLTTQSVRLQKPNLKLVDVGLAPRQYTRTDLDGLSVLSALYLAPEVLSGRTVGAKADLYALGSLTFRILVGYEPFKADDLSAILYGHTHMPPPALESRRPDLAGPWSELVKQLLAKRPEQRPKNAKVVAGLISQLPV